VWGLGTVRVGHNQGCRVFVGKIIQKAHMARARTLSYTLFEGRRIKKLVIS
jgi:hypothetical protein